jgi:hypothetical protein
MSVARSYDGGARLLTRAGINLTSAGVPSSSGGVAANGASIDRHALDRRYYSCRSIVRGRFVGSTINAVTLAASFQHSSDGTSWDNFSTGTNASAALGSTGATGAQAVEGVVEQRVNLLSARRYIRQVMTPTFAAATSGDIVYYQGSVVFTGGDEAPNT